MTEDRRKVVRSPISVKAMYVTNLAECARRYGKNKKTKILYSTVVEHLSTQNNPNTRQITNINVGDYDLGGGTIKRASLNIRSVKAYDPVPTADVPPLPPPGNPAEDDNGAVEVVVANDDAEVDAVVLAPLAEELIDNGYSNDAPRRIRACRRNTASPLTERTDVTDRSVPHIIYTKRKRKFNGEDTKHLLQGRCMVCQRKTSSMCSECNAERVNDGPETKARCPWICDTKSGRDCFLEHLAEYH